MFSPLISIIIPIYNRANLIGETIASIKAQSYSNWECIIVDDGSTDDTLSVLKSLTKTDDRFILLQRPSILKKGPNSCRNYGYSKSKGTIINWFDSDDLYAPNILETILNTYEEGLDGVVCKVERFDHSTEETVSVNRIISDNLLHDYLTGEITFYVCGPFWHRKFIEKQDCLFDIEIRNLDDWDFNLRMLYQHPKLKFISKPLIKYRKFHLSLSKTFVNHDINEIQSAFFAREKHVLLLKQLNDYKSVYVLNTFILAQYKKHLKALLYAKVDTSRIVFKWFINKQIGMRLYFSALKSYLLVRLYLLFYKGHFLLKRL